MNEEKEIIINGIDVSECPCKDDDKCMEVPILNEYGDLIDYQDCEPQTFCPYRSKTKIKRLQEENEELKARLKTLDDEVLTIEITPDEFERYKKYKQALEKIRKEYTNSIFYQCDKTEEECPCHNCIILGQLDRVQNIVKIIDEALNDRN